MEEQKQQPLPASNNLNAVELAQFLIYGPWAEDQKQRLKDREKSIRELQEMMVKKNQSAIPLPPSS